MTGSADTQGGLRTDLDLRAVRYFVAVADHLHFGRAASSLNLSQPALSRAVSVLEDQLGERLLERTSRRVRLTTAGATFIEHGRELLVRQEHAITHLRERARGRARLVLGFVPGFAGPITEALLARHRAAHPELDLRLRRIPFHEQTLAVRQGRVDASFARLPWRDEGVRLRTVLSEPRVLLAGAASALAEAPSLRTAELAGTPICRPAGVPDEVARFWTLGHGSGPLTSCLDEALEYVAAAIAVAVVPRSVARRCAHDGIVAIPLADAPPSEVALAWHDASPTPQLRRFIHTLDAVVAGRERESRAARRSLSSV